MTPCSKAMRALQRQPATKKSGHGPPADAPNAAISAPPATGDCWHFGAKSEAVTVPRHPMGPKRMDREIGFFDHAQTHESLLPRPNTPTLPAPGPGETVSGEALSKRECGTQPPRDLQCPQVGESGQRRVSWPCMWRRVITTHRDARVSLSVL